MGGWGGERRVGAGIWKTFQKKPAYLWKINARLSFLTNLPDGCPSLPDDMLMEFLEDRHRLLIVALDLNGPV